MPPFCPGVTLTDRVGPQSHPFFKALSLSTEFLSEPVDTWGNILAFQKLSSFVEIMRVTNNASERLIRRTVQYYNSGSQKEVVF